MKKISRKNFSGLSHLASKAGLGGSSSSSAAAAAAAAAATAQSAQSSAPPNSGGGILNTYGNGGGSNSSSNGGGGILKRPTWADKVREKLPELGENEYEVLWERGVLGVIFLESEKDGIPYVSKATESCISPLVHAGDVLKYVNVVRSQDHSFSEFFKILATMKKPVLLRFERPASSTTSSDGEDNPLDHRSSSAIGMGDRSFPDANAGAKVLRSNSVPQGGEPSSSSSTQPKSTGRSAFWRTVSAKDRHPTPAPAPVITAQNDPPVPPVQALSPNYTPHVKLQPPIASPYSRGGNGYPQHDRVDQHHHQQQQQYNGHVETKHYDVSPRDVYAEYAQHASASEYYEYEVYWETGSLGLFFGEDRVTNLPVVTRSTPNANSVVQRMVAVNDTLVSANNVQSRDYSFEAFFARLQQMNKPVRLVFKRKVDASPASAAAHAPARGRKASVTVDSLTSPEEMGGKHRSPGPPHQLTIVEDEERPLSEQAVANGARTPPDSPTHARESHQDAPFSRHSLDIDISTSPAVAATSPSLSRDPPPALSLSSTAPDPVVLRRNNVPSPLNLARDAAVIMSGGGASDSQKGPSPSSVSWESTENGSSISSSDLLHAKPPPPVPSSRQNVTRQTASESPSHSQSQSKRSPAPSPRSMAKEAAPAMTITPDLPTVERNPAPSLVPAAGVSTETSFVNTSTLLEQQQEEEQLPASNGYASSNGIATFSPPPSPKRPEIQRLSDLDVETKAVANKSEEVASSRVGSSLGRSSSESQLRASTTKKKIRTSSSGGERISLWEEASQEAPALALESIDAPRLSVESAPSVVMAAPVYSEETVRSPQGTVIPVVAAVPTIVTAAAAVAASEPEEVAVGVEMGVVADYAMGIVVEASVPEASPVEDVEPAIVAFQGEPILGMQPGVAEELMIEDLEDQPPRSNTEEEGEGEDGESFMKSELEAESSGIAGGKTDLSDDEQDVLDAIDQDITADIDGNDMMPQVPKIRSSSSSSSSSSSPFKTNKATVHANLAKYKRKAKNSRAVVKLPALTEEEALTVPLVAPNAVNTTVQVRGRSKPKPSMLETPDSKTYLVKWKESRSIGLQLKEVRFAKGVYPLVTDVCQEPCCEALKHVCVGDVIVEINGRNTSLMGVKKTVSFLKTCTKTTLLKLRHGPGYLPQRVSAYV